MYTPTYRCLRKHNVFYCRGFKYFSFSADHAAPVGTVLFGGLDAGFPAGLSAW